MTSFIFHKSQRNSIEIVYFWNMKDEDLSSDPVNETCFL